MLDATRSSGFSTCIGWPCLSLSVEGLFLTLGEFCSGAAVELALRFAMQMEAKSEALFEISNCIDYGVGRTDQFVARCGDSQG